MPGKYAIQIYTSVVSVNKRLDKPRSNYTKTIQEKSKRKIQTGIKSAKTVHFPRINYFCTLNMLHDPDLPQSLNTSLDYVMLKPLLGENKL